MEVIGGSICPSRIEMLMTTGRTAVANRLIIIIAHVKSQFIIFSQITPAAHLPPTWQFHSQADGPKRQTDLTHRCM